MKLKALPVGDTVHSKSNLRLNNKSPTFAPPNFKRIDDFIYESDKFTTRIGPITLPDLKSLDQTSSPKKEEKNTQSPIKISKLQSSPSTTEINLSKK